MLRAGFLEAETWLPVPFLALPGCVTSSELQGVLLVEITLPLLLPK